MIDVSQIAKLYIDGDGVRLLYINGNKVWEKPTVVLNGLAFTAKEANSTIQLTSVGTPDAISLEYSTNNGSTYSAYTVGDTITISSVGKKVLFRAGSGGNTKIGKDNNNYYKFVMTGKFNLDGTGFKYLLQQSGTISTVPSNYTFKGLLYGCTSLVGNLVLDFPLVNNSTPQRLFMSTFRNTRVESVSLAEGLQYANTSAFGEILYGNTELKTAQLNSIKTCSYGAFSYAFVNCTSLEEFQLLGMNNMYGSDQQFSNAFRGCSNLKIVKIPLYGGSGGTGSSTWARAFEGCTHLEVIDFSQATSIPVIATSTFTNTNSTFKVVVPDSLYSSWIAATNWSAISSQIVKASEYTPAS